MGTSPFGNVGPTKAKLVQLQFGSVIYFTCSQNRKFAIKIDMDKAAATGYATMDGRPERCDMCSVDHTCAACQYLFDPRSTAHGHFFVKRLDDGSYSLTNSIAPWFWINFYA